MIILLSYGKCSVSPSKNTNENSPTHYGVSSPSVANGKTWLKLWQNLLTTQDPTYHTGAKQVSEVALSLRARIRVDQPALSALRRVLVKKSPTFDPPAHGAREPTWDNCTRSSGGINTLRDVDCYVYHPHASYFPHSTPCCSKGRTTCRRTLQEYPLMRRTSRRD